MTPRLPTSRTARVLWVLVVVAAVALVAVTIVSAVTERGDEQPSEAARYIVDVNRVMTTATPALRDVNGSYRRFRDDPDSVDAAELARAEQSLREVRTDVAAVPAPEVAARLRRALLRLLDGQVSFARDLALLGAYLPAAEQAERELERVTAQLRRDVGRARTIGAQGAAFDRYAARATQLARRLRAAEAPVAFAAARDAEATRIEELGGSASSLAAGLRGLSASEVNAALDRFAVAATGNEVARERRRAIVVYGRRLRELVTLQAQVERERRALEEQGA